MAHVGIGTHFALNKATHEQNSIKAIIYLIRSVIHWPQFHISRTHHRYARCLHNSQYDLSHSRAGSESLKQEERSEHK